MPNWCECDIRVDGSAEEVERFVKTLSDSDGCLSFDAVTKDGPAIRLGDSPGWCDDGVLRFDVAWSPPLDAFRCLRKLFPGLDMSIEYFECGAAVCGGLQFYADDADDADEREWQSKYEGVRGG